MATSDSSYLKNYKGNIQKTIVVKQYEHATIITSYPDMNKVKYNELQKNARSRFSEAILYARSIINDPVKKAAYSKRLPGGKRLYNAAIQEYLNPQQEPFSTILPPKKKRGKISPEGPVTIKQYRGKEVITRKPDMSGLIFNENQKKEQNLFARAVAYARSVVMDPVKKAAFQKKLPRGKKVYHAALQAFLKAERSIHTS